MRVQPVQLSGIPKTMLIPLRARYLESNRSRGIIFDPKSIEILTRIEDGVSGGKPVSAGTQIGVSIRTEILDEQTRPFLEKHPDAVVVNLGCGLDTRFHRIDNGTVTWFDLDVPEAIDLRKKFFEETGRFKFIAKSVTDYSWLQQIPKDRPLLFLAEGLLMYFPEDDIKELFLQIGHTFPGSDMLFEAMAPFMAKNTDRHPDMKGFDAQFKWGIPSGADLEQWNQGIEFIEEWYYFERHKTRWPLPYRLAMLIPAVRKGMKIIHIRF